MATFFLDLDLNGNNELGRMIEHIRGHIRSEGFKFVGSPTLEKNPLRLRIAVETDNTLPGGQDIRQKILDHFGMTKV